MSAVAATTSLSVNGVAWMPFARYQAFTPATYALRDREHSGADGPLRRERVDLVREECLGFDAGHERLARERDGEWVETGNVERRQARRAADQLEEETAIRRRDPPRAVGDVGFGAPGDVGDAVAVPDDRHSWTRTLAPTRPLGADPEPALA